MSQIKSNSSSKKYTVNDILTSKTLIGETIIAQGWVKTRRDSKAGFSFIALSDGTCFNTLQIVTPASLGNYQKEILRLTTGCAIRVTGKIVTSPAAGQALELHATDLYVLGWVDDPETYPITPKHHSLEYLREHAHLRARTNTIGAAVRVSHTLSQSIHRFLDDHGFFWIHTPIITTNDCEGGGQLFKVTTLDLNDIPRKPNGQIDFTQDFFGREAFLTVSGQLNAEAYCQALTKVYTFGPTFRAENSNTTRHLAEFWMVEPEVAFADLADIATLASTMLQHLAREALEKRRDDMEFFAKHIDKNCIARLEKIIDCKFIRMEYSDAIAALQKSGKQFEFPVQWGLDLQSEHERYLTEEIIKGPVIVMNYPKEIKGFYMRQNDDGKTVAAMDVLVPGIGEIIGGSQREERYDVLAQRINELKMNRDIYRWYLDLRRYGSVPHSGFGIGSERLICYMTGLTNIRDAIPFPRTTKHAEF